MDFSRLLKPVVPRRALGPALLSVLAAAQTPTSKAKQSEVVYGDRSIKMHNSPPVVIDGASLEITSDKKLKKKSGTPIWSVPGFGVLMGVRLMVVNERTGSYLPTSAYLAAAGVTVSIWLGQSPGTNTGRPAAVVVNSADGDLKIQSSRPLAAVHDRHANKVRRFQSSAPAPSTGDWFQVEWIRIEAQGMQPLDYEAEMGDYCRLMFYDHLDAA
jgi:hypothetical protein